jgi:hydrophobic/amphiphilic exporter-1 (mainly G- bacteria), HAE1 family
MQKLAEICIKRPVFAAMLILGLVVVGAAAYARLGVDRVPSVDLPTVTVRTTLPGAAPENVENEISRPIEEAVNTVEGIEELRSVAGQGSSFVIVTFNLSRDINVAAQDVRDRVASVVRRLPAGVEMPIVSKSNNDSEPVLRLALSGNRTLRELTELADKVVKTQIERSAGVGEIRLVGSVERTVNIWVEADRLAAYQIPITAVRDAIERQNIEIPGGFVSGEDRERTLRTMGKVLDPEAFNDVVISRVNGVPIRIRDIGHAEDGTRERRSVATLNGVPTVSLDVIRQSGANTVATIEAVKANVQRVLGQLPPDVRLQVIRDQSNYINAALHEINLHLILGSTLACLVVLAFMRSWRSTVIAGVAIPASLVATFAMMWALDFTLNSVTMLALVLMVGVVIDDAIVVLENIFRFVEEKKLTPMDAAREATREIGLAVTATTLSLVVIFIPVSFMSSISGRFLYQFGITAAVAVMVSLLVSFTLTPMMSSRMLRPRDFEKDARAHSRGGFYGYIDSRYERMLSWSMRHRAVVAAVAVLVMLLSIPIYQGLQREFVPSDVDEGEFSVRVTAPEGASVAAMERVMRQLDEEVRSIRGVELTLTTAGGGFIGSVNNGDIYVRIAPHDQRVFSIPRLLRETLAGRPLQAIRGNYTQRDVMEEVNRRLRKYPDLRARATAFSAFNIGGGNFDIDFVIRGPELESLHAYGEEMLRRAEAAGGFRGLDTTLKLNKPELRVEPDVERAQDLGVSMRDIGATLRLMVGGDEEVSRFRDPLAGEDYDVQLRLRPQDRTTAEALPGLFLPSSSGQLVELRNVARIIETQSPSRIDRLDRGRQVSIRGGVAPGYGLQDRIDTLRQIAAEMNLPPAYSTYVAGRGRELERTFEEFLWAFALSVVFMYMILASQFESLVHPLTILLSLPLAIPFALFSLYATGGTLNLYSALGILVLFGVVKKNSILQIDHTNAIRARGVPRFEAIIEANRERLRPILMTTLTLVAGMMPLALGTGPGAEERRAVAVVVIGGQSLALLLTLLVTPVAYSLFDDAGVLLRRRRRGGVPEAAPLEAVHMPVSARVPRSPTSSHPAMGTAAPSRQVAESPRPD